MPLRIRKECISIFAILLLELTASGVFGAIVIQPSNTIVNQGESAILFCQFSVPPKSTTTCSWTRDGTVVNIGEFSGLYDWVGDYQSGNCSFKITGADISRDDAQWICQLPASSQIQDGEKSNPAKLSVYVTPTPPVIYYDDVTITSNSNISVSENDSEEFKCESSNGNPAAELVWELDNRNVKSSKEKTEVDGDNNKTYKKTIELDLEFTKEDNGKILRCSMHHKTMDDTSQFIDVQIQVMYHTTKVEILSPNYVVVDEGSGYQFDCKADGNPPAKYEWLYKKGDADNWEIKSKTGEYYIESAGKENEGEYMCMAGNDAMLPSAIITFQLRSATRNAVALIGGIFGALLIIAIVVLAVVVWRLRRKLEKEAAGELPNLDMLNRASGNKPNKRLYGEPAEAYMIPMPNERAPLNPPYYPPSYNPLLPPRPNEFRYNSSLRSSRDTGSHIYAEPKFYDEIDGCSDGPEPPELPPPNDHSSDDGGYLTVTGDDPTNTESNA